MSFGKTLENLVKYIVLAPRILARYGSMRPHRVRLAGNKNWIYIDPSDGRAQKKLIHNPIRGRVSPPLAFWRAFNAHLEPSVAVDVGVNYGECLFGTCYPEATQVFGFEANPRLMALLEKSRAAHPDASRISIIHGLVSDQPGDHIPFYVDPAWSGTASAIPTLDQGADKLSFTIQAHTLDSIIPRELVLQKRLLFKMDIEGYESRAIAGFTKTIESARLAIGFVEFNSRFITEAGESPENFFHRLMGQFDLYRMAGSAEPSITRVNDYQSLVHLRAAGRGIHTDLILVTRDTAPATFLPPGWTLR